MNIDDYIPIIFILIFFIGPLLRKMFESISGGGGNEGLSSKPSDMEVQEYLKKMRGNQQNRSREYHAPSSRPNNARQRKQQQRLRREDHLGDTKELRIVIVLRRRFKKILSNMYKTILDIQIILLRVKKAKTNVLEEKVMASESYTTFQKAIILQEIISKPKSLLKKNPKDKII